jgi:hypothetical protein
MSEIFGFLFYLPAKTSVYMEDNSSLRSTPIFPRSSCDKGTAAMPARRILDFAVFAALAALLVLGFVRAQEKSVHIDLQKHGARTVASHPFPPPT